MTEQIGFEGALQFLDVYSQFLSELNIRQYSPEKRAAAMQLTTEALRGVLNKLGPAEAAPAVALEEAEAEEPLADVAAASPGESKEEEGNSAADKALMQEIESMVYSGGAIRNVWRSSFEGALSGPISVQQFCRSLEVIGVKNFSEQQITRLIAPFLTDDRLSLPSLVRFLGSVKN